MKPHLHLDSHYNFEKKHSHYNFEKLTQINHFLSTSLFGFNFYGIIVDLDFALITWSYSIMEVSSS